VLDAAVWSEPVTPFLSPVVTAQIASEPWQLRAYFALRHAIFVDEQAMFERTDRDEHDTIATPIVVLGHAAGMPDDVIGAVRIYPAAGGTWYGGRLGVCRAHRARGVVGSALIFAAVCTAHARGCTRFLATVQEANVAYFERHRFVAIRPVEVCGRAHRLMQADLAAFPRRIAHALEPVDGAQAVAALRARRAA
jgi:putative N-acetyltransferase (TIGR04045 family)